MKMQPITNLIAWLRDDWHGLTTPGNQAAVEAEIAAKNLIRCQTMMLLLLTYETLCLALTLLGRAQADMLLYLVPTAALLIVLTVLLSVYVWKIRARRACCAGTDRRVSGASYVLLTLCCCILMLGDIRQHGQSLLHYPAALALIAMLPLCRFRQLVWLLLLPFATVAVGCYTLLGRVVIVWPLALFLAALCVGVWRTHATVAAEETRRRLAQSEEQLRLSEERCQLALTQSGKSFFLFDVASNTARLPKELAAIFNALKAAGGSAEDRAPQNAVAAGSAETFRTFFANIHAGERTGEAIVSFRLSTEPQRIRWLRLAFVSVLDSDGKPRSAIVTYEDVTEQCERQLAYQHMSAYRTVRFPLQQLQQGA